KLHHAFTAFAGIPTYRATCADHATREFASIDELKQYENLPGTHVVALQIKCQATNPDREASLTLHETSPREKDTRQPNVWIGITGAFENVRDLNEAINQRLTAMRPWYRWLAGITPMRNLGLVALSSAA